MPDRNTKDERERYDHSGHPIGESQPSDLKPAVQQPGDRRVDPDVMRPGARDDGAARRHAQHGGPEREHAADPGEDAAGPADAHRPQRGPAPREQGI